MTERVGRISAGSALRIFAAACSDDPFDLHPTDDESDEPRNTSSSDDKAIIELRLDYLENKSNIKHNRT